MSRLTITSEQLKLSLFLWRKKVIPRTEVWRVAPGRVSMPPLLVRSFIEICWMADGERKRLYFVPVRRQVVLRKLEELGWPVIDV